MFIRSVQHDEVSPTDVLVHFDDMRERGLAPTTIQTRFRAIRAFFNWAYEWELIANCPTAKIKTPRAPKVRKPFIAGETVAAVLKICPLSTLLGARRQSMIMLFASTGMRKDELHRLQLRDLDWANGRIRIMGKGQKERAAPFLKDAQRVVHRYQALRFDSLPTLWVTEEGRALAYDGVSRDMARLFDRVGVEVQDPCHIFRRTFAANARKQGIADPYIRASAGRTNDAMLNRFTAWMEIEDGAVEAFREFDPFRA